MDERVMSDIRDQELNNNHKNNLKMKTKSKITHITGNGSFENDYGAPQDNGKKLLFKHEYTFEDGTVMEANHKTTTSPFSVGEIMHTERVGK